MCVVSLQCQEGHQFKATMSSNGVTPMHAVASSWMPDSICKMSCHHTCVMLEVLCFTNASILVLSLHACCPVYELLLF